MQQPKNKGTKSLFGNPVLEKLSRTHISIPIILFIGYASALIYWSVQVLALPALTSISMFLAGWLCWTLFEYAMHRYIFHMATYTELRKKIQYTFHGIHHEFPKDKDRLAMPPLLSVCIGTILLLLFKLILGDFAFAFMPGFMVGYTCYLGIHYMVHAFAPPKNFFKSFWVHHGIHHYKAGEKAFGVSTFLWDRLFKTMP
ncbi:MAG TPA: sterol desaturase family protein [Cyclobacteriaceae bacterium]|nr:sterol desaturase family protein [Cyclobacteriaceae bacterium]